MTLRSRYYRFRPHDGEAYGSFQLLRLNSRWYWQACWPACLPDSEALGPYRTALRAYRAAQGEAS